MSGLSAFLQTELLSLSSEARRKHPEIKEAAERLSAILRSFKERPGYSISNELSKSDDALRPFVLACETKQVKLVTIAIGCIQKLISYHAIPETSVRTVLRTLTDISVHGVDIQLKILQTVLPLLTNYNSVHDDILAEALLICFRLQDSKIVVVNNTAAATLRQLVIYVFDKVAEEDKQELPPDVTTHSIKLSEDTTLSLHPCAKDAYYLFQDLCLLTNNEPPEYLRLGRLSETFGLELIESVLTNHYTLFRKHKELSSLLRERVCAMIIKTFSEKHEFPQTMRFTRVVYILIKQFSEILVTECEIFLSMFVKILEPENPLWQRVLAMEIFRGVCGNPMLLCSIYDWYDCQANSTNVFRDMITAFGRLATERPQLLGATQGGRDSIDYSQGSAALHPTISATSAALSDGTHANLSSAGSTIRIQCIDQLDKTDPPAIPDTYIFYLALLCLNSIADGLAGYTLPRFSTNNKITLRQQDGGSSGDGVAEESVADKKDLKLVTDMANVAWPGLLAAMSFYITTNLDEDLFQSTMRSYQNFTNVCGILGLVVPRDAFLTNLCKNAIPPVPVLSSGYFAGKNAASSSTHESSGVSYMDLTVQQQQLLSSITFSDKNLYSLRVLLNITMMLSGVLGSSWYLVLETLQQADFLLYNRTTQKGNASAPGLRRTLTGTSTSTSSGINLQSTSPGQATLSQMMDADHVSIIYTSLNRLFENSKFLDNDAFTDFTAALCRLSAQYSGVPYNDDELDSVNKSSRAKIFNDKSFAMEKLHDISLMNMGRLLETGNHFKDWDLIMSHLITTANYINTPSSLRTQSCEIIPDIIIAAMNYALTEHKDAGDTTQNRLLKALNECINGIGINDKNSALFGTFVPVQKMGLETLNNLLQTSGHSFTCGWGLIFDMLCHVTAHYSNSNSIMTGDTNNNNNNSGYFGDKDISDARGRSSVDTTTSSIHTVGTPYIAGGTPLNHKAYSGLIKIAFSSLQLICTDFLSTLSPDCIRQCIVTLESFGTQCEDLNISLTAVGLLWNLSDFIQTKRLALLNSSEIPDAAQDDEVVDANSLGIDKPIGNDESPKVLNILWMLLLLQLSKICIDGRPEVRNGAIQTLFRTIIMNGSVLGPHLWQACIWQVLFPLLDAIRLASIQAAKTTPTMYQQQGDDGKSATSPSSGNERDPSSGFMIHHSRDTTEKQWDETKVLVLTGISKSYRDFLLKLYHLPTFVRAWTLLLSHLENYCLRSNQEVALAAVKSMKSMVTLTQDIDQDDDLILELWRLCWESWVRIGTTALQLPLDNTDPGVTTSTCGDDNDGSRVSSMESDTNTNLVNLDSDMDTSSLQTISEPISKDMTQETLTTYINMFIDLYKVISAKFSMDDVKQLLAILRNVLVYSTSPTYRPDVDHLSPLQEAVLNVVETLDMNVAGMAPLVLMDLCEYMTLAFMDPQDNRQQRANLENDSAGSNQGGDGGGGKVLQLLSNQSKFSTVTYIALNKKCSTVVANLFKSHVKVLAMYTDGVFERVLSSYGVPMKLKYDCPPSYKHGDNKTPLWKTASNGFLEIICIGLEALQDFGEDVPLDRFIGVWRTLVDIFEGNLLSPSTPPTSLSIEELDVDEHFDISILSMIQNDIVVYLGQERVPSDIIKKFVNVIRESSRLYYVDEHEISHRDQLNTSNNINSTRSTTTVASNDGSSTGRTSDLVGTTGTIIPVMKESFAYAAFKLMFGLCSAERKDSRDVRKRIAQTTIPILLERCETILRNYTTDEPLLGRCPFPRYLMGVRKDEMLFFLRQSIQLQLQQGIMDTAEKGSIKGLLLSSPRAHLFYLYPSFCSMLTCDDHAVVELVRECLRVAGLEMGFDMGPSEI